MMQLPYDHTETSTKYIAKYDHTEDCERYLDTWMSCGSFWEFGVYKFGSAKWFMEAFIKKNIQLQNVVLLDSFCGLPEPINDPYNSKDWRLGSFSSIEHFNVKTTEEAIEKGLLELANLKPEPIIINGWYKDLNSSTIEQYKLNNKQASFINCDCDIYQSTVEMLNFMLSNQLIQKNCIIRFDDFCSTPLWLGGESKAWNEAIEKYYIRTKPLSINVWQIYDYENGL